MVIKCQIMLSLKQNYVILKSKYYYVCLCCLTVPYVPVYMHCVISVMLCTAVLLCDLHCTTFRMHLVFARTAAWSADRQTRSGDVIRERQ